MTKSKRSSGAQPSGRATRNWQVVAVLWLDYQSPSLNTHLRRHWAEQGREHKRAAKALDTALSFSASAAGHSTGTTSSVD